MGRVAQLNRYLICPKCAAVQVVHVPSARAWHVKCPLRVRGKEPPEMKEQHGYVPTKPKRRKRGRQKPL